LSTTGGHPEQHENVTKRFRHYLVVNGGRWRGQGGGRRTTKGLAWPLGYTHGDAKKKFQITV
jgi:hypothetical protein